MKPSRRTDLIITVIGALVFLVGYWCAGQTGYGHPDPARRDANIGAGMIAMASLLVTLYGASRLGWTSFSKRK